MLHTLKPAPGSIHRRKRVGRGNASGHGTFSTRGAKGQKARAGGRRGLIKFAVKGMVMRLPKKRGFTSPHIQLATVSLVKITKLFKGQASVTPVQLAKVGLIKTTYYGVKIVGNAPVTWPLTLMAHGFSKSAKAAINASGGQAVQVKLGRKSS